MLLPLSKGFTASFQVWLTASLTMARFGLGLEGNAPVPRRENSVAPSARQQDCSALGKAVHLCHARLPGIAVQEASATPLPAGSSCDSAPLSVGFSRQEHWSGLPYPPPGDLPGPGIEPESLMSLALADGFFTTLTTWEAHS